MKDLRELFGNYKKGILEDNRIEELHRLLIDVYFSDREKLNQEEKEYTEDLIFELYAKNELIEEYAQKFGALIEKDKSLNRKFLNLVYLVNSTKPGRDKRRRMALESGQTDEKEEEELKAVLQEVLENAHAEEEASVLKDMIRKAVINVNNFFSQLTLPDIRLQPRVRYALNAMSQAAVLVFMVTTMDNNPEMLSGNKAKIAIQNCIQYQANSPGNSQVTFMKKDIAKLGKSSQVETVQNDQKVPAVNRKMDLNESSQMAQKNKSSGSTQTNVYDGLLASMYAPPGFEYSLSRGETTTATDLFVLAADKYKGMKDDVKVSKDYDSCIIILQGLLNDRAFKDKDTLNEIRFFLGSSYLKTGIDRDNGENIEKALAEFKMIDPQNEYYLASKWYCALAYLKLGKTDESLRLCDTLIGLNDMRYIKAEALRDSINEMIKK
jgi:hypothetical protein